MDPKFGGVIWTKHALARLQERGIKQGDAWATFQRPEQSRFAKTQNAWIYYKTYGTEKIEVVAKQNERKEWLILTVWSRPVYTKYPQRHTEQRGFLSFLRKILNI
jgi:hypothetical protein